MKLFWKKQLGYRLLQVNKIFDNFLWNLLNLICSSLARCFIYSTILILSSKSNLLVNRTHVKGKNLITAFNFDSAFSGLGDVLLSGLRALSEQYPMAENYSTFK